MEEILNLHLNKVRLIIKSLNNSKTVKEAAEKCGLADRTLYRYMKRQGIEYSPETKSYIIVKMEL